MYLPIMNEEQDSALICLQLAEKQYLLAKSDKHLNFLYDNYGNYYLEFNDIARQRNTLISHWRSPLE